MNDAALAVTLLAADERLGGIAVRGNAAAMLDQLGRVTPLRRCPAHVDCARLLGGLDLSATLAAGRPVLEAGLIEQAAGGILVVAMAERLEADVAGALAAALDAGQVRVVLLDSGTDEEQVPAILKERVAFWVDADDPSPHALAEDDKAVVADDALVVQVSATAQALAIDSMRAPLFAVRAARALARMDDRPIDRAHLAAAVRMVLVPRATQWPEPSDDALPPPPDHDAGDGKADQGGAMADTVLAAVAATLPPGVLDAIRDRPSRHRAKGRGAGAKRKSPTRGRPVGVRAGLPRSGLRLALLDTLRAAAPWQKLRGVDVSAGGRIAVRKADLRVRRYKMKTTTTTIFAVDASGSAAAARMAEAKGAVELLLTQAYVKRAHVALVAFRGDGAETVLPPTRSLTRARRLLAELPGGGGTPIAAGLDAARMLALGERAKDRTPQIVVLTDGRANVPSGGTAQASADRAARAIARDDVSATLIDISARPRSEGRALAEAMAGRYVALPRGSATDLSQAIG